MATLQGFLSNLTDPDGEAVAQARDLLLSELNIPPGWGVGDDDIEIAQDGTQDWLLVSFEHESNPDTRALVFLLAGSHVLQLYIESDESDTWSDTTRTPEEVAAILREHA